MDKYSKYSPSEMLTLLLDGELDGDNEQIFYDSLSQDAGLQSELKDQLSIREAVRNDTEAFTPPAELSRAVFANLGFGSPLAPAPPKRFFKRYAVLALLLLFVGSYLATTPEFIFGKKENSNALAQMQKDGLPISGADESQLQINNPSIPVVSSLENVAEPTAKNSNFNSQNSINNLGEFTNLKKNASNRAFAQMNSEKSNNRFINSNIDNSNFDDIDNISHNNIAYQRLNSSGINDDENSLNNHNAFAQNLELSQNFANNQFRMVNASEYTKFSQSFSFARSLGESPFEKESALPREKFVVLRGIYALTRAENNLQSGVMNSFSVGGFISSGLARNLSLGFEFGREPYSQIFLDNSNYSQKPEILWLGVGARYDLHEFNLFGSNPFAQIIAGGSELGPIVRTIVGASKIYSGGIGFNIGIEGSSMIYKNQNKYYHSDKIGFTGGLIYKF